MKKKIFALAVMSGLSFSIQAQSVKFGSRAEMIQKRNSKIENPVGTAGNNYMVVISDFGKSFDFNNNVRTNIARYSTNNLADKGTVYLNPLVAEGMDEDKVIFTDVFQWKGRILGFYSIKGHTTARTFSMYARFFDNNIKPLGKIAINMGEISYSIFGGAKTGKRDGFVDGRHNLNVREEFRFRISNDSSKLAVVMPANENNIAGIKIRLYDTDLNILKEVFTQMPLHDNSRITDIALSNSGTVYILVSSEKSRAERKESQGEDNTIFELHAISTSGEKIVTKDIGLPDKSLLRPSFLLDSKERPTIVSLFHDYSRNKEQGGHGIYTAKYDPITLAVTGRDQQDFNEELLSKELSEKDIKKNKGTNILKFSKITPRNDGGFYALGQSMILRTVSTGTNGSTRDYWEYGIIVHCYIDASGKVRWSKGIEADVDNLDSHTSTALALPILYDNKMYIVLRRNNGLKKKESAYGIKISAFDETGKAQDEKFVELPEELQEFGIVAGSFYPGAEKTFVGCLYYGFVRGHNEMELAGMQIKF